MNHFLYDQKALQAILSSMLHYGKEKATNSGAKICYLVALIATGKGVYPGYLLSAQGHTEEKYGATELLTRRHHLIDLLRKKTTEILLTNTLGTDDPSEYSKIGAFRGSYWCHSRSFSDKEGLIPFRLIAASFTELSERLNIFFAHESVRAGFLEAESQYYLRDPFGHLSKDYASSSEDNSLR